MMNEKMRKRQALSASISADALLAYEEKTQVVRREFAITDILTQKIGKKVDSLPSPLAPVSVRKNELRSPIRPLDNYAERLDTPENTALFAYASTMCHRVTGRYLPRTLLQSDPEVQQRELERVQRDPEILRAIDSVRVLSAQFKDIAQNTMGHRKDLGLTLFRIEESYLKLFEKLLELSLRLYWDYEQRTGAERREDRATAERWREKYERKCNECVNVNKKLAAREIIHRAREIELKDYQGQMREIENELGSQRELEAQILQMQDAAALQRVLDRLLREDFTLLSKNHDEMLEYQKQLREEHKQLISDLRRTVQEKDRFISKQEVTLRQLEEIVSLAPVVYESQSSQTEVDDDGLWDVQDGIPRFVSKNVIHKTMWRRFNAFVSCKNCGGRPLPKAAKTNPFGRNSRDEDNEEADIWSVDRSKKHTKKAAKRLERTEQQWELPSHIVLFLSNLPKSVVAFRFYKLEQVIETIEAIYEDKFASDKADESDGVARDELSRFICEYFLKTHGLRQSAEIGLYRFLISVKSTYQRNSHVRLFARLSNLLKIQDENSEVPESPSIPTTGTDKKKNATSSSQTSDTSGDFDPKTKKRSGYLDRSFLRVFLEARHYLLRAPPRAPPKGTKVRNPEAHGAGSGSPNHKLLTKEHAVQVEPTKMWVPLDHAITVLRWYINCLSEDIISTYCRQVEYNTAIYDGRTIAEIAGNRLAVRAEMRRAMLANESSGSSSTSQVQNSEGNKSRQRPMSPCVVADVHKVLNLLMDALEQRREGIKKDLTALFDAGDMNHDCVLNLDEFGAIIRTRKPHFSDRRILRMFREALMGGVDQSFALSMEAFVVVCNDHGLVSLLPDDRMVDPFDPVRSSSRQKEELIPRPSKPSEGELSQAANAIDLSSSLLAEIPENISWDDSALPSARAEEIDEDEHLAWETPETELEM